MKDLLRDAVFAATVILVVLIMSGCATIRGMGEDIVSGTDAAVRGMQDYSYSYNEANGRKNNGY